jgi:hypothetical protein
MPEGEGDSNGDAFVRCCCGRQRHKTKAEVVGRISVGLGIFKLPHKMPDASSDRRRSTVIRSDDA